MKKLYFAALCLAAGCFAANAQDDSWIQVGESDCTTAWWTAFSDLYTIPMGQQMHVDFVNYSNEANNWNNWLVVFTNNLTYGEEGYAEYGVVRCDNYGWGGHFDPTVATYTSNYNWNTFTSEMNGSKVSMNIYNRGDQLELDAEITSVTGNVYNYNVKSPEGAGYFANMGVFFTVEGGYLLIDPASITITDIESDEPVNPGDDPEIPEGSIVVGSTDCSTAWWSVFSDLYTIPAQHKLHLDFTNYNNGTNNWCNWVVVFTNNLAFGAEGYAEYGVVRCDNYGWGDYFQAWDVATYTSEFDWDTFISEMNGSQVSMDIYNRGTQVEMDATITAESGNVYHYNVLSAEGDFTELGVFFTVEGAYIVIDPESISITEISGIASVAADENAPVEYYDLQGRKLINPAEGTMCIRRQGAKAQVIVK